MQQSTAKGPDYAPYDVGAFPIAQAPEGVVDAVFAQGVWGKSSNLFSCFRTRGNDLPFRLATFSRNNYAPYEDGPSMRYAVSGDLYRLTIGRSGDGRPTFLKAESIDG